LRVYWRPTMVWTPEVRVAWPLQPLDDAARAVVARAAIGRIVLGAIVEA
jgi:hypothetical protein